MLRNSTLALLASPGAALAHGGHAPLPEVAHGLGHLGPWAIVALLATGGGLAIWRAMRR